MFIYTLVAHTKCFRLDCKPTKKRMREESRVINVLFLINSLQITVVVSEINFSYTSCTHQILADKSNGLFLCVFLLLTRSHVISVCESHHVALFLFFLSMRTIRPLQGYPLLSNSIAASNDHVKFTN
jgi:hypothetical protein